MLRKIKSLFDKKPCIHPEHNPPMHIVLESGTYEWKCTGCGGTTLFEVNTPTF